MTGITELAQSLKAAAEKATPGPWEVQFDDEIYATDGVDNEQVAIATLDARDADYIALANPANVLALVEALEKAQQRIDELESRTVTFKLPSTPEPSAFAPWVAKAFYQFHRDTVKSCFAVFSDACATAGIKVEAE
ncbi:ead/Ea22-like family protein [Klebsiella pneumoniae]|uniref:ead/Ea22-like family protein n=1 Tax=Klebsiella pneumoniae TaxID=573 RepID=UPI001034D1F1|nr:ead/Ea22-like family protein [Klebsiella pneumoniae]HBR4404511.1 ead/Ea22-like family protein [Klebsiella pneumoniae]HDS2650534.1 ead/Ea22-like family protein [Klebsiella pneumoniae subsp. pneumoniae]